MQCPSVQCPSMQCPSCNSALEKFKDGDLELDACKNGCGGIWFNRDELLKIDEQHEFSTNPVLKLAASKVATRVDHKKIRTAQAAVILF